MHRLFVYTWFYLWIAPHVLLGAVLLFCIDEDFVIGFLSSSFVVSSDSFIFWLDWRFVGWSAI